MGYIIKNARVYTNDPKTKKAILTLKAFVKAPTYVLPPYVSFYGLNNERPTMTVEVKAGLDKPLTLEAGAFNLAGKVAYDIREIQKGRVFHVRFAHIADASESYRGYLNLKTNYPEKPVVNIRIIGRFLAQRKTEPGSEVSPASHDSQRD